MDKEKLQKKGLISNGFCIPYNPQLTDRAKGFRNNMTEAECKLWKDFLSKLEFRFRPQKQIENYIVDFYCAKLKLIIEIDGEEHDSEEHKAYDKERTSLLESYGLKVIRFRNSEVIYEFDSVCKKIYAQIKVNDP